MFQTNFIFIGRIITSSMYKLDEIGGEEIVAYLPVKAFNWKKNRIKQTVVINDGLYRFVCTAYPHDKDVILYNSSVELSEKIESKSQYEFVETKEAKEVYIVGDLPYTKYIGTIIKNECLCFG